MPKILITAFRPSVYGAGRMADLFALGLQRTGHEVQFAHETHLPASQPSIVEELRGRRSIVTGSLQVPKEAVESGLL